MTRPSPMVTVCSGALRRTFASGRDIVVGRDVRADLRLPHPAISRAHLLLRCTDGQWTAVDVNGDNGMFVGTERVTTVDIRNRTAISLASPEGPRLTFELVPVSGQRPIPSTKHAARQQITLGRAVDNDIILSDAMASRHHAVLVSTASDTRIDDLRTVSGTFVNGGRITRTTLRQNDIVTVGTSDLVFSDGTLARRTAAEATTGGLDVCGVGRSLANGETTILDRISFEARPGTLTAVVGPSGSGKSSLLTVIVGRSQPTSGVVRLDGRDLHAEYDSLRGRIGYVPQDDVVHRGLTPAQALNIAAQLRLPPDTGKHERRQIVSRVLEELEMTEHANTRVKALSAGQRKRTSIAIELLTEPSLLVLDEPATGVDPAQDREAMAMLRCLADAGRVIVVVTHALRFIDVCDQVLLLAPGGKTAYLGSPGEIGATMGSVDWADIYTDICADPDGAQRRYVERRGTVPEPSMSPTPAMTAVASKPTTVRRQTRAAAQRQVQLVLGDGRYLALLGLAPAAFGVLLWAVGSGFTEARPGITSPLGPLQTIVLLSFGAILLGLTLSVRDLTGERAIYRHERACGLSPSAYLLAKLLVFGALAAIQSALLVLIVTAPGVASRPPTTAALLSSPRFELFVDVAATAATAVTLGLVVSSLSRSNNQFLPLLATTLVAQLVFAGAFLPISARPLLEVVAAVTPARWGVAATASTVDLPNVVPGARDPLWERTPSIWLFDIAMLAVLACVYTGFVRWRLRPARNA